MNDDVDEARADLGRAIAAYYRTIDPDIFVDGWALVVQKRTPDLEADGASAVTLTTPDQSWVLTRGLLDIALHEDRTRQNADDE